MPVKSKKKSTRPKLSHSELLKIHVDPRKAASIADLVYVTDTSEGISRLKNGQNFKYTLRNKSVKDKTTLERIKKLVLPPAWTNVWICPQANGHIQATGMDVKGRKQYKYHPDWHSLRHQTKFHHLYEFGKALPKIRLKLEEDMSQKELTLDKVLATVISLIERTYIRIGNNGYEKLYGSYGLTTMKDKHVKIEGKNISFSFKGKKGIYHNISLRNQRLAKTIQACRDIPGKELFQYYDAEGNRKSIDSGMVNSYIKDAAGMDFTAKDFRTWAGSLNILWAFKCTGEPKSSKECKKKVVEALDEVSSKLGNTRTVCKKYYVHPGIIRMYEDNKLKKYIENLDKLEEPDDISGLTDAEKILMRILKNEQSTIASN
ncbi:MAG TPA: hypothetical protein VM012_11150 [Flavitalea sp.]|nr:hypothetical protein [Flavitalea sp.]